MIGQTGTKLKIGDKMATKSDPTKNNQISVKDDIGKEMIQKTKENIQKELEQFQKNYPEMVKHKERFEKMWARDKRMYELMLENGNYKKIEPQYQYETVEEYWDIRKSQLQDKFDEDRFLSEQKIAEYTANLKHMEEEMKSCEKQLKEFDKGDEE